MERVARPSAVPEHSDVSRRVVRTLGTLALLGAAFPLTVGVTGLALLRRALMSALGTAPDVPSRNRAATSRTVLLSGGKMTKSLALARGFHAAGHRVVMVETARYRLSGHRFSRAVDSFHIVPAPDDPNYADALLEIVEREGVDVYVPVCSPVASRHDALAARVLAPHCEVLHVDADVIDILDDKHRFAEAAAAMGLGVPDTHRITDPQQVLDFPFPDGGPSYILKSIPYDPVHRLDLTRLPRPSRAETEAFVLGLPISQEQPWILQEFVPGQEYCTHGTVRDGELRVWACCESSPFQVNYAMVEDSEIRSWVRTFAAGLSLSGQVSFDFIRADDGRLFAIECNPRTHSAVTMFHDHPGLAGAYLGETDDTITPREDSRPTYWLFHELWRMVTRPSSILQRAAVVLRGRDATFSWEDPLPFLLVPHLQIPSLLMQNLMAGRDWVRIDFNIGKLIETGGD